MIAYWTVYNSYDSEIYYTRVYWADLAGTVYSLKHDHKILYLSSEENFLAVF